MVDIKSINPKDITRPDLLYRFDLAKHLTYTRTLAVTNIGEYARAVDVLKILLSPYIDGDFEEAEEELNTKLKDIKDGIENSRDEEEVKALKSRYTQIRADLYLQELLKLMDRTALLLEQDTIIDFGEK